MARLKIGSYIIDSADTSSSSTTSGVQLDLDEFDPATADIGALEYRWPVMFANVTAASQSALKTAIDAVRDAIRNCQGKDIVYEETSGTTLFNMSASIWPQCEGNVIIEVGELTADIAISFIGRSGGPVSSGAADEPGLQAPIVWQYQIADGGQGGLVVEATFGPTLSGDTVTAGARQNANTFITKYRSTANYPTWLSTNFRPLTPIIEFDQKQNQATIAESSYDPCRVTWTFLELNSTLAANANWPSLALAANYSVDTVERDPIDVRSGQDSPGFDYEVTGNITLKSQGNTTFNSSETKLTDATLKSTATTAVNCIATMFGTIYADLGLTQLGLPRIGINPITGAVTFAISYTTATIMEWNEEGHLQRSAVKTYSRATNGAETKYKKRGGPVRLFIHNLRIKSLDGPKSYRAPLLSSDWDPMDDDTVPLIERGYSNGQRTYTTTYQQSYRYVNPGPDLTDLDKAENTNNILRMDTIGNGLKN